MTAVHRGDSTDVTKQGPDNSVRITPLSEDGKAPQGCLNFLGALIQDTSCR
jgi:hypothetical protein